MKTAIRSLLVGYITFAIVAALVSCKKEDAKQPPVITPPKDTTTVKHAAVFTSSPIMSPDTLYWKTSGGSMSWGASYAKGATLYVGTTSVNTAADFQSANVPALEQSATGRIDLVGEDDKVVTRNVNYPVYDSNFTYITKGSSKWKEDGDTTFSVAFPLGYQVSSPDLNLYIYYKTIVNGKRSGMAIAPNGSTSTGWWNSLSNGSQFQNGGGTYNNIFLSETRWIMERTYLSGGVSFTRRIHYKVVP